MQQVTKAQCFQQQVLVEQGLNRVLLSAQEAQ